MAHLNIVSLSPDMMLLASKYAGLHIVGRGRVVDYLQRPPASASPVLPTVQSSDGKTPFTDGEILVLRAWMSAAEAQNVPSNFAFETLEAVVSGYSSSPLSRTNI